MKINIFTIGFINWIKGVTFVPEKLIHHLVWIINFNKIYLYYYWRSANNDIIYFILIL